MHAFLKGGTVGAGPSKEKTDKTAPGKKKKPVPWVEKYRPKCVDDVAHQDEVVSVLRRTLQGSDLPNLLFYGPPGTGKTSTILAAARELFGPELMKDRILELNASDERGINVIREKVKKFSQLTAGGARPDGKPCPGYKIVILDEADSMTKPAQAALRRTMEKESRTTRFCLICNYVSRIIEPITSRCAKFRFKPLAADILTKRLEDICKGEEIEYDDQAIGALVTTSEGDMRKAITYLQSAARLKGGDKISTDDIMEIAGVIPDDILEGIIKACHSGSYEKLEACVENMMAEGYSASQLIGQIHDKLVPAENLTDKQKAVICERLSVADKRLMDGGDEYLQIMDVCTVIMYQICHAE